MSKMMFSGEIGLVKRSLPHMAPLQCIPGESVLVPFYLHLMHAKKS